MPTFVSVSHSGRSTNVLSDPMVGGIFAGQNTGTGRTAYLAGGIPPCEFHPLIGNAVDVWGFVKSRPLIGEIPGSEIVHQNKQYILLLGEEGKWRKKKKKGKGLIHDLKAIRLKMDGKGKQRTKTKLFVVGPHAKNEHSLFFIEYFVNYPVLDIDSARVATEQVAL